MISCDINVLIYAFDSSSPRHLEYKEWLERALTGVHWFYLADPVWSGFLRISTNPRIFSGKISLEKSLAFVEALRQSPNYRPQVPGADHYAIFSRLARDSKAQGNDLPDVYLAALCIETGCRWVTTDQGFRRFRGLKWGHPLD